MNSKKFIALVLVIMFVASPALTLGAFASVSDEQTDRLLDGQGGFFRDLINSIGGFVSDIVKAIGNGINLLLSGIKRLFIPSKESFTTFRDDILFRFDTKFGSVFSALNYLKGRFGGLSGKRDLSNVFKIVFPKSSFLSGLSIDLLAASSDILAFFRFVITGGICLFTAFVLYKKVISMVKS